MTEPPATGVLVAAALVAVLAGVRAVHPGAPVRTAVHSCAVVVVRPEVPSHPSEPLYRGRVHEGAAVRLLGPAGPGRVRVVAVDDPRLAGTVDAACLD